MVARIIIGALVAAFAAFLFGFFFWAFLDVPQITGMQKSLPAETTLPALIVEEVPVSGVYAYPYPPALDAPKEVVEAFKKQHVAGPNFRLILNKEGGKAMAPATMAFGFLHHLVMGLLIGTIISVSNRCGFFQRWLVGAAVGLVASLWSNLQLAIWFGAYGYSGAYICGEIGYSLCLTMIFATILALLVKEKQKACLVTG